MSRPGADLPQHPGGDKLVTSDYTLLPGDLREASQLIQDLKDCEFKAELPTLIIAECVLVYMPSTDSQALISSLGALLPTAAFIVYEQVLASQKQCIASCVRSVASSQKLSMLGLRIHTFVSFLCIPHKL